MKVIRHVLPLVLPLLVVACGSESTPSGGASNAPGANSGSGAPRVYFIEPKDGATVKSPVHLKFGMDNYTISPVPAGDVTTARPGMAHHHVGVDQDCLPAGTTIVKGTPSWVHFGTGSTEIDMQLTPGQHKLTLQPGDDLHKTIDNLCQTITVNVTE
jgi:hypothetical protein